MKNSKVKNSNDKKFSIRTISKIWKDVYGETLRLEYSGFYKQLKNYNEKV